LAPLAKRLEVGLSVDADGSGRQRGCHCSGLFPRLWASSFKASALVAIELEPVTVRRCLSCEIVADSPVLAEQGA
jgi:hypothetical protein